MITQEFQQVRLKLVDIGIRLLHEPFRDTDDYSYPWIDAEHHAFEQMRYQRFRSLGIPVVVCPWCGEVHTMPETFPNEPLDCSTGD